MLCADKTRFWHPVDVLDCSRKTVCVSLRSAKITASGCGNYIGLTAENGSIKEMLGSRGELRIGLDIYSPSPNCDLLKEQICAYMGSVSSLTVTDFEAGEVSYDGETEMHIVLPLRTAPSQMTAS